MDGDTIEQLLRQQNLTLDTTITMCRAQEAAKTRRKDITDHSVLAIRQSAKPQVRKVPPHTSQMIPKPCPGCGLQAHQGGRAQCPAFKQTCRYCLKVGHFAMVCHGRQQHKKPPAARAIATAEDPDQESNEISPELSTISLKQVATIDPAPTVTVHLHTHHGSYRTQVLPDSGADISAAGEHVLPRLNEYRDNLLPSEFTPRAANGQRMHAIGKLSVRFQLAGNEHEEDVYIFPHLSGVIVSWRVAKALKILPPHYPLPPPKAAPVEPSVRSTTATHPLPNMDDLKQEYPTVFDGRIRTMEGEEFHISLTADAKPFCVNTPRSVPFAYRDKLQAELDLLQTQSIITPVTEATEWCAPIVVTPKKNSDKIRMCVDLSHLNRFVVRERYQSLTPAQAVADIAASDAKYFTVIDALKGYHQCPLDQHSQPLTTFITPFGRFKYLRAPYGISSISEHYNRRMTEAFKGLSGFRHVVDDFVIYDDNITDHIAHVKQFLQCCADQHIALNAEKCRFFQTKTTFAGFLLSDQGYQIDPSITEAISKYPVPTNRTELRSFIGLVNQLSSSTSAVATLLTPFRPLLSTKNEFTWSPCHDTAFIDAKKSLTTQPTLAFFDLTKPTRLSTDASRQGLWYVLQQRHGDMWSLVQAGSRFLSDAESWYAIIELELLAVAWAATKCKIFLAGLQHFSVVTDHNPLIPILNNRRLDEIENARLQRLKSRLMAYNFTAQWIKGKGNNAPDALSRNPVLDPQWDDSLCEYDCQHHPEPSITEIRILQCDKHDSNRLHNLREEATKDPEYQQLHHTITRGFPDHRNQLPEACRHYWNIREHLTIDDGFIVYGCRLLIPASMRQKVLANLHESHQGAVRTKERARLSLYWPGIDNDIDNVVLSCKKCQDRLPSNCKEPIMSKPKPSRPFQEIAVDFGSYGGQQFLIMVDCLTDWPDIIPMRNNTSTQHLVQSLTQSFCRTAVPDIVWSDGGPQFTYKCFNDFASQWGFEHKTSSPHYPQSNGKIEATVKSMKKIIASSWGNRSVKLNLMCRALLQYRNTPSRKDGQSPTQKLYGRPIQDTLPAHRRSFSPEWQRSTLETEQLAEHTLAQAELYYNSHAQELQDIQLGSTVALQNPRTKLWDIYGTVVNVSPHRRYSVKTQSGRVLVRNKRFL